MKTSGFSLQILILCLMQLAPACRPQGGGKRSISVHQKSEADSSAQSIQEKIAKTGDIPEPPREELSETPLREQESVTGFDQVFEIFNREAYGPCSSCHESEWPYLSKNPEVAWKKFLQSLDSPRNGALTKEDLTKLIIGCADIAEKNHCSGDPLSDDDNLDEKMPTKFGYDAVSAEDLQTLQKFLADGVQEESGVVRIP